MKRKTKVNINRMSEREWFEFSRRKGLCRGCGKRLVDGHPDNISSGYGRFCSKKCLDAHLESIFGLGFNYGGAP